MLWFHRPILKNVMHVFNLLSTCIKLIQRIIANMTVGNRCCFQIYFMMTHINVDYVYLEFISSDNNNKQIYYVFNLLSYRNVQIKCVNICLPVFILDKIQYTILNDTISLKCSISKKKMTTNYYI